MLENDPLTSLDANQEPPFNPFLGPKIERVCSTTRSQEEIWTGCKLSGDNANKAYNESISLKLLGELHFKSIEQAIQTLVNRHESLRSTFSTDGRFMTIFSTLETKLKFIDLSTLENNEKELALNNYLKEEVNHLFDLAKGPLLKPSLIKTNTNEHLLVLTAHHIICDGWSLGIILQELSALYSAYATNKTPNLPEPDSFCTYADEQLVYTESSDYTKIEQYWIEQYKHNVPLVDLPTDFPRPPLRAFKSSRLDFPLDSEVLKSLKETGIKAGSSLASSILTSFEVFLHQLTGKEDLIVGQPASGQSVVGKMQLIGHCVNILPLRSKLSSDATFNSYLKQRKSELLDAYEHQQLSVGHLLQKLPIARDASRVPLIPVVLNIDLGLTDNVKFTGLTYELISNPREYETFEIFLNASGTAESLVFEWSYNSALFKPETIKEMMASFELLLKRLSKNPDELISKIASEDYMAHYNQLNNTNAEYSPLSLPDLIKKQVQKTPNKTALVFNKAEISYTVLQQQVNQLSHYLTDIGVKPGDLIGVSLNRCTELPIVLLAILQCSAAFVPLDPKYPAARLEYMIEDSGAKLLITSKKLSVSFPSSLELLCIEDIFDAALKHPNTPFTEQVNQEALAYHIYTSGSTGKPKGVRATHKNLVNFLCSMVNEPGLNENDRLLSITSMSFDPVFLELFAPLITGATIILADDEMTKDGRLLLNFLQTEQISLMQATPTTWQMLLDIGWTKPLALKILCGGEALTRQLADQLLQRCDELWNIYGPTETTVWSIIQKINRDNNPITIGKPIANMQLYLLNESNQLVAPGKVGEICISGAGMTLGYWNRAELNEKLFIKNSFSDKYAILYKSGDLGKLLPNGEVQCLGRVDHQIKIRGHRIEPGEIEKAIVALDGVQNAVVVAKDNVLAAYLVPNSTLDSIENQISIWRNALKSELPTHMVPQDFIVLKELPKTPNGKIDRKSLMAPKTPISETPKFTAPRTKYEHIVAKIWQKCLGIDKVDVLSNFFELGGHSIIAVKVMTLIEKETGKHLPLATLIEHSTVEKLAKLLEPNSIIKTDEVIIPIKPNGSKPPLFIVHGAGLNVLIFNKLANNLNNDTPVYGIQGLGLLNTNEPLPTIEEIAAKYIKHIVEIYPEGPYCLAGYSLGGYIAYEMARQLKKEGKKINTLIILDTYIFPEYFQASPIKKRLATYGYHFERLSILFKDMTSSWSNFKYHIVRKKTNFKNKFLSDNLENEQKNLEDQGHLVVDKRVLKLLNRYTIVPDNIEIDLFRAEEKTYHLHDPIHLGWNEIALNGVEIHDIPGDHLNILLDPNVAKTSLILQKVLDMKN